MQRKSVALAFGVGLLSASVLMEELLLTRLFSVTLYYHFAFMAVAVAMLGLGAGGLLVYLNRPRFQPESLPNWLITLGIALAIVTVTVLTMILDLRVPVQISLGMASHVALVFFLATLPFLFAGALFSLLVWRFATIVHRIYFYDLLGAALGSLAVLPGLRLVGAPSAVLFAAALAAASSFLLGWATGARRSRLFLSAVAMAGVFFLFFSNLQGNLLDVRYAKGNSTAGEIYARWNDISRVCVHSADAFYLIRIDCDAATPVPAIDFWKSDRSGLAEKFSRVSEDLAQVLRPGARTLVIGSGGGNDVARALAHGSRRVVAVEINPLIARDLMLGFLRDDSRRLFERPEVELVVDDARSTIQRTPERFEVMQSTLIDTWASTTAGAFALSESYLYTVEAFEQYLRHVTDDGILIVTRWEFVPPRQALRVVSLGRAAMERMGIAVPAAHFLVVQDGGREVRKTSVLMKRSPFTAGEIEKARAFLAANPTLRALYFPGDVEVNAFSSLLRTPNLEAFVQHYPYDISPTRDARPFFFFTTRWNRLLTVFGSTQEDLKNNVALFILALLILIIGVAVFALVLLPKLFSSGGGMGETSLSRWFYFLAIGVAYIVVEIALVQTFILFMGHPTYGMTVVVFSLLVSSGLGSRWSGRLRLPGRATVVVPVLLGVVLAGAQLFLLPQVLPLAQGFSRPVRGLVAVALIAPLGFLMGIPFPSGVRAAESREGDALPWLWSANAGGSVFGSVVAVVLAMAIGIPGAGTVGGGCYLLAALAARRSLR